MEKLAPPLRHSHGDVDRISSPPWRGVCDMTRSYAPSRQIGESPSRRKTKPPEETVKAGKSRCVSFVKHSLVGHAGSRVDFSKFLTGGAGKTGR